MERLDNSKFLLYIEPKAEQKSKEPINDEITKTIEACFNKAEKGTADYSNLKSNGIFRKGGTWRGIHSTECKTFSTCQDYLLDNGMITNSLCVFYLQYYRKSIPKSEMQKVHALCSWVNKTYLNNGSNISNK
jgi:hypothetical protein